MPEVRFKKPRPSIEVEPQSNLMQALLAAGHPVASSCKGDGVCAKCIVEIISGSSNLSSESALEKYLRERHGIPKTFRVSCQVQVQGDITIDTSYW